MTWNPCTQPWTPYGQFYAKDYHTKECSRAAREEKVPLWTTEDVVNLARRVRRAEAKSKP